MLGEKQKGLGRINNKMRETGRERFIVGCARFAKKHPRLKGFVQLYMLIVLSAYYACRNFARNGKRFSAVASALVLFLVSVSFCYPYETAQASQVLFNKDAADVDETLAFADDDAPEELEEDLELEQILAEGFEGGEATSLSEITEYSADEILAETYAPLAPLPEPVEEEAVVAIETEPLKEETIAWEEIGTHFDKNEWSLLLVNKQHPIPDDYEFPLGNINATMNCDQRVIAPLKEMLKAASKDGVGLVICSPYRDLERQEGLFARKIAYYMDAGFSYMDAYNLSSQAVTVPGSSEHQIGLAFDIVCGDYYQLDEGFGETPAGKWLAENSYKYGFCLRYLKGKENITGIEYEPWHFRYVGVDAATVMHDNDLCLEEFWDLYLYE